MSESTEAQADAMRAILEAVAAVNGDLEALRARVGALERSCCGTLHGSLHRSTCTTRDRPGEGSAGF